MAQLTCIVVTPEATVLEQSANFIAVNLFDGELGIYPGRAPLIGRLGYGELRLRSQQGSELRYYIDGGFVQVADDVVSIITSQAIPAGQVDAAAAREQLQTAQSRPASSSELLDQRDRLVTQARAKIRIAEKR